MVSRGPNWGQPESNAPPSPWEVGRVGEVPPAPSANPWVPCHLNSAGSQGSTVLWQFHTRNIWKYMGNIYGSVWKSGIPPNGLFFVGAAENDDNQRRMGPETTPHDGPPRFWSSPHVYPCLMFKIPGFEKQAPFLMVESQVFNPSWLSRPWTHVAVTWDLHVCCSPNRKPPAPRGIARIALWLGPKSANAASRWLASRAAPPGHHHGGLSTICASWVRRWYMVSGHSSKRIQKTYENGLITIPQNFYTNFRSWHIVAPK